MRLTTSPTYLRILLATLFIGTLFTVPAGAQTDTTLSDQGESSAAPSGQPEPVYPNGPPENLNAAEADGETGETEPANKPPASKVLVSVDKGMQEMTVFVDGIELYTWPVSTGLYGYSTPSGSYTATSMNKMWRSREWDNAPMPHAIFFTKKGHAIHGTHETKKLGSPASKGCVRLAPDNAETLFNLVKEKGMENTEVVLAGETPGGEAKIAAPARQPKRRAYDPWFDQPYAYQPPPKRRGLFGRKKWRNENAQRAPRYYYQPRGVGPWGY